MEQTVPGVSQAWTRRRFARNDSLSLQAREDGKSLWEKNIGSAPLSGPFLQKKNSTEAVYNW